MPTRILVFILLAIGISYAQSSTRHYNLEDGLAIEGYDPVAYFTMGKALKGDPKIVAKVNGVRYNFMTEAHKALFVPAFCRYFLGILAIIFCSPPKAASKRGSTWADITWKKRLFHRFVTEKR